MSQKKKRQIAILKRDISAMTRDFVTKIEMKQFNRPDVFVEIWRCLTKVRLLARLEGAPVSSNIVHLAGALDITPERLVNLANIGEWIQVDRDTRHWEDPEEYDEYWLCHYDGDQTVESYHNIRKELKEIKELNELWTM